MNRLNFAEYLDKVHGCWAGKNIGGTLGLPFEGKREMHNISFYVQKLNGIPEPNDDLDLQLIWLGAVECRGLEAISPRLLGEYWQHNIAPCSEYSIARFNIARGLLPPLSGACNNDRWKSSNGAWIRSEIWACLCPGAPDEAIRYAYMDASIDHCGEGVYAEMFTAAMQSAAFIENDPRRLIEIALSKIPADCRTACSVKLVCKLFDDGKDWRTVREAIVAANPDFASDPVSHSAPANIAFTIIGFLFGNGDFGESICLAVNCGEDTDCTAATLGALLGIMYGFKRIPPKWLEPIGTTIQTICISMFGFIPLRGLPRTLDQITNRVANAATASAGANPLLLKLNDEPTSVAPEYFANLVSASEAARIWSQPLYYLDFNLTFASLRVIYEDGPIKNPGDSCQIKLVVGGLIPVEAEFSFRWRLPVSWTVTPAVARLLIRNDLDVAITQTLHIGEFCGAFEYPELEIIYEGRAGKQILVIPFQLDKCTAYYDTVIEGELAHRYRIKRERVSGPR